MGTFAFKKFQLQNRRMLEVVASVELPSRHWDKYLEGMVIDKEGKKITWYLPLPLKRIGWNGQWLEGRAVLQQLCEELAAIQGLFSWQGRSGETCPTCGEKLHNLFYSAQDVGGSGPIKMNYSFYSLLLGTPRGNLSEQVDTTALWSFCPRCDGNIATMAARIIRGY